MVPDVPFDGFTFVRVEATCVSLFLLQMTFINCISYTLFSTYISYKSKDEKKRLDLVGEGVEVYGSKMKKVY